MRFRGSRRVDEGLAGSWLDGAGEEELACLAPVLGEFPISNLVV